MTHLPRTAVWMAWAVGAVAGCGGVFVAPTGGDAVLDAAALADAPAHGDLVTRDQGTALADGAADAGDAKPAGIDAGHLGGEVAGAVTDANSVDATLIDMDIETIGLDIAIKDADVETMSTVEDVKGLDIETIGLDAPAKDVDVETISMDIDLKDMDIAPKDTVVDAGSPDSAGKDTATAVDAGPDPCVIKPGLCDDGSSCTTDLCQPGGLCLWVGKPGPCDDGNACTTGEACQGSTCVAGVALACDDLDPCTADACSALTGCSHVAVSSNVACGDASKCQSGGVCSNGKCIGAKSGCNDGNPCTVDSCAPGGCSAVPLATGSSCGKGGVCDAGKCSLGFDSSVPAASCAEVLQASPKAKTDSYWLGGAAAPVQAWCEMALGGGGWTLLAVVSDDGQAHWTWSKRTLWTSDTAVFGALTALTKDYKSALLHVLPMKDLLFVHAPSGTWAQYSGVGDGSHTLASTVAGVPENKCYPLSGGGFALSAGTLKAGGNLCDDHLYFNPADHDADPVNCDLDPSPPTEDTYGPAWNVNHGQGCFDDPGQAGGLGPVLSDPNLESGNVGFGWAVNGNKGAVGNGANRMQVFVR